MENAEMYLKNLEDFEESVNAAKEKREADKKSYIELMIVIFL